MRLKKINAVLALLSTLALYVHMGYNSYAYLTFYYNPTLKILTMIPLMLCCLAHGITGMCSVFLLGDGTRLDVYLGLNRRTIAQRISAALIFPLLIVHLRTYAVLSASAEGGTWLRFALILVLQVAFYVVITAHVATSFSRALITLGLLGDRKMQKSLDKVVYVVCTVALVVATCAIVRGQLAMFLPR